MLAYITSNSWLKARVWQSHTALVLGTSHALAPAGPRQGRLRKRHRRQQCVAPAGGSGRRSPSLPSTWILYLPRTSRPTRPCGGAYARTGAVPWSILSPLEESVMDKMQLAGHAACETGPCTRSIDGIIDRIQCNAFIINDATRQALIAQDPNSAEVIKPVLRGKDIRRYKSEWAGSMADCSKITVVKGLYRE